MVDLVRQGNKGDVILGSQTGSVLVKSSRAVAIGRRKHSGKQQRKRMIEEQLAGFRLDELLIGRCRFAIQINLNRLFALPGIRPVQFRLYYMLR